MKRRLVALIVAAALASVGFAQVTEMQKGNTAHQPKLIADVMLLDAPFLKYSGQSTANYNANAPLSAPADVSIGDYMLSAIGSPSMSQVIGYTSSFYNTMNYGVALGWNRLLDPAKSRSSKVLNAVGAEFTAAIGFVLTTKVPLAGGWAHEEFHKNTWIPMGIGSYNTIWDFDLAPDALTYVGSIYDEDLAAFKREDPAGFVRMGSAGIEAHYLLSEMVQTQDFLYDTNLPNLALYWADFFAAIDYVNRAHTVETIGEHDENYLNEPDQLKRDFTGNDFTAWVYDLYNSEDSYDTRGIHPTGIGVDRYRDYNDLSDEMLRYLKKIGNRQWLNVVNPFMFRVREIRVNENLGLNFVVRHYLTSFGDDTQFDLFLNRDGAKSIVTFHKYSNHHRNWYPGLEIKHFLTFSKFHKGTLAGSARAMGWIQPKKQAFFTDKGQPGGLVSVRVAYHTDRVFQPYMEVEAKSEGWVAGVPYLGDKISSRFGIQLHL